MATRTIRQCSSYGYIDNACEALKESSQNGYAYVSRILTQVEIQRIRRYLKADRQKDVNIRQYVQHFRRDQARIKQDLVLLEQLLTTYEKKNKQ